jgi:exopolysaccharide production protein ExoQ
MPPTVALLVWIGLLLALLISDPARSSRTSISLWMPLIWMFFILSRLPAQWLGGDVGQVAEALEEGNSLDRTIFSILIVWAVCILFSRSFKWTELFVRNPFLMAFLLFALVSVVWSDFPFVSFKRWFRDLGNYLAILVVLSDAHPLEAVRIFLRRLYYLLIPLSILLVKYYAQLGKHYSIWSGAAEYVGVATSKNTLGALCLFSGIYFFWDTVTRWSERKERQTKRIILVNVAFLAMTMWLLVMSQSATSRVCLIIGCLVILMAHSESSKRHPNLLKVLMPTCFFGYLILAFGLDLNSNFAGAVGRDPSFTGRTNIWQAVLSTNTNPLIGTGYSSFWLGSRLGQVWRMAGPVNESHNGYLEIYLNLGIIGLVLLAALLISSYKATCRNLTEFSSLGSLSAALWTIALFYNMTEASFTAAFMCLTFLLGTIAIPQATPMHSVPGMDLRSKFRPSEIVRHSRLMNGSPRASDRL